VQARWSSAAAVSAAYLHLDAIPCKPETALLEAARSHRSSVWVCDFPSHPPPPRRFPQASEARYAPNDRMSRPRRRATVSLSPAFRALTPSCVVRLVFLALCLLLLLLRLLFVQLPAGQRLVDARCSSSTAQPAPPPPPPPPVLCSACHRGTVRSNPLDLQGSDLLNHASPQRKHVCPACWAAVPLTTTLRHILTTDVAGGFARLPDLFAHWRLTLDGSPLGGASSPASLASHCPPSNPGNVPLLQLRLHGLPGDVWPDDDDRTKHAAKRGSAAADASNSDDDFQEPLPSRRKARLLLACSWPRRACARPLTSAVADHRRAEARSPVPEEGSTQTEAEAPGYYLNQGMCAGVPCQPAPCFVALSRVPAWCRVPCLLLCSESLVLAVLQFPVSCLQSPVSRLPSPVSRLQSLVSSLSSPVSSIQSPPPFNHEPRLVVVVDVLPGAAP